MRDNGPVVVKLGGSFAFSAHLRDWVETLAACAGRVVIVPGGGPFADAVRSAQPRMGFDDTAAHHMALLAMEQFGLALANLDGRLSPADSADAIHRALAARRVPVWMPVRMALAAPDIAPTWDETSDSLAAWLSDRIGASRLILVKHGDFHAGKTEFEELAAMGIVDRAFPRHVGSCAVEVLILGPTDHAAAIAAIRDGATAGVGVE